MPIGRAVWVAGDLDALDHFAGLQVADLEAKQLVDIGEYEGLGPVDGKWPNEIAERTDGALDRVVGGGGHREQRRLESGQINVLAVEGVDGVVRFGLELQALDFVACGSIDDIPDIAFERRLIDYLAVRR